MSIGRKNNIFSMLGSLFHQGYALFRIVRQKGWHTLTTRTLAGEMETSSRPIYSFFASMGLLEDASVKRSVELLYDDMTRIRGRDQFQLVKAAMGEETVNRSRLKRSADDSISRSLLHWESPVQYGPGFATGQNLVHHQDRGYTSWYLPGPRKHTISAR